MTSPSELAIVVAARRRRAQGAQGQRGGACQGRVHVGALDEPITVGSYRRIQAIHSMDVAVKYAKQVATTIVLVRRKSHVDSHPTAISVERVQRARVGALSSHGDSSSVCTAYSSSVSTSSGRCISLAEELVDCCCCCTSSCRCRCLRICGIKGSGLSSASDSTKYY